MRRFISEFALFVTLLGILFVIYIVGLRQHLMASDHYLLEYADKVDMLERTHGENRLLLLGGSNVCFGVDSHMLSDSIDIEVVNFGLHAGLGLPAIMDGIEPLLQKDDIIVFMPEYDLLFGDTYYGESSTLPVFALAFPIVLTNFNFKQVCLCFSSLRQAALDINAYPLSNKGITGERRRYSKLNFDKRGDEIAHLDDDREYVVKPLGLKSGFSSQHADAVIDRLKQWHSLGCEVLWLPPCIQAKSYEANKGCINILEDYLKSNAQEFSHGFDGVDNLFEDDEIFDTYYHLNRKGRVRNTLRVLNSLNL